MAEQIGLEGIFDLGNFSRGISKYTKELSGAISQTDRAAGSFGRSWTNMGNVVAKTAGILGTAVVAAGAAAGAAVVGFAASGIKGAMDLQAQMSNIAATLNTTAEAIAPLKQLIMDLALDPNLTVSATEAAQAIENLARNGLTMQEILDGAAHSTVLLANATGADFGTAADIATDTMAIFNVSAEDMATAVDGIVSVTNASKFTIDDYRLALAQAGAVAAGAGVSMEDFNTVIAGTASRFASGSDGGTSFKTTIQRLIPTTKEAHGVMTDLGLITTDWDKAAAALNLTLDGTQNTSNQVFEAFRDIQMTQTSGKITTEELNKAWSDFLVNFDDSAFFDATGNMEDMNEVAIALHKAFGDLTEEQRINALTTIAGADASRTMLGLIDLGAIAYTDAATAARELGVSQEEVNKVIADGVTEFEALQLVQRQTDAVQQAEERNRNFAAALKILKDTIGGVQLAIGDLFLPMLEEMARGLNDLIKENAPAIIAFFESLRDWLATAIPQAIEGFKGTWATLSTAFTTVKDAVTPVAEALGNIASTLIDKLGPILSDINPNMDAFKGALTGISAVLAAATITAGITAIAGALATLLTPMGLVILAAAGLGIVWNTNFLGMRDKTIAIIDEIKEAFTPLTTAIEEFGSGALTEIQDFVTGNETEFTNLKAIWDGAKESFANVSTGIQESAASFVTYLKEQFPQLTPVIDGFSSAVSLVVEQVKEQFTLLQDATSAMISLVTSLIDGDWTTAWQSAKDLVGAFVTYIEETFANVKEVFETPFTEISALVTDTFTGLVTTVSEQLPGWQAQLVEWGDAASQWIIDAVPQVQAEITAWYAELNTYVTNNLPTWTATLKQWGDAAWQWIVDAIPEVKARITAWYAELSGFVAENLPAWQEQFAEWTTALSEWIAEAVPAAAQQLGEWFSEVTGFLAQNLPGLIDEMSEWITALWEWIAEAVPPALEELGKWLGDIIAWIPTGVVELAAEMLTFAATLVEWIGDNAADAIPELAKWMGRILAWIPQGIAMLAGGVVKLAGVLISWIGGASDGVSVDESATGKLSEAFGKFLDALLGAIEGITGAFVEGVKAFVDEWNNTISDYVDWNQVGQDVMTAIQAGIEAVTEAVLGVFQAMIDGAAAIITETDWQQLGSDVVNFIKDGVSSVAQTLINYFGEIAQNAFDAFLDIDWVQLGKDIIDGIMDGLRENGSAIIDYIVGLGQDALDSIKELFGIGSPSKIMMQIGRDIIEGWLIGMQSMSRQFYDATQDIAGGVVRIAERAGSDAISAFTRALQSFSSINILDRIGLKDEAGNFLLSGAGAATGAIQRQQEQLEFLKMQADLVEAIRESGANPGDVLAGITLGPNADPVKMAEVIARTMARLNQGLTQSLQAAMSNAQGVVDFLRDNREDITEIEERFTREHLSTLDRYKDRLAQLDDDLAEREERAIATGNPGALADVRKLDDMRQVLSGQIETLLAQRNQMARLMEQLPTSDNQRARGAIESFRERFIDPLAESFETANIEGRANILQAIEGYQNTIRLFAQSVPRIAAFERHALQVTEGFGEAVKTRIDTMLANLYNPANVGQQNVLIEDLRAFTRSLIDIRNEINRRSGARESGQSIIEMLTAGPKDLLGTFEDTIASIDARIERAQEDALATGNALILNNIRLLDSERDLATQRLQDLLNLRKNRRSIEDIEERFTSNQLTTMERFAQQLENIDQRIASAERSALAGNTGAMSQLAQLDRERSALLARVESFLAAQNQVDEIQNRIDSVLASQPVSDNQRGQAAIERWRETMIDPLIQGLESLSIAARNSRLQEIERRMRLIQGFAAQLPSLTGAEQRLMQALEGFGTGARNQAEKLLALIYDPRMASVAAGRAQAVHDFANSLINLRGELERMAGRRLSKEDMLERIFGSFDQLTAYQNALDAVDRQIAAAEAAVMETGSVKGLDRIQMLDERREQRQAELENFLRQTKMMEDIMRQVKNFSGPGQASAERFFQEHIQALADAFSFPMRSTERDAWIRAARDRVGMINRFVEQMRDLERVQNRVVGNQAFAHLADEFAQLQDILLPEEQRGSLIRQLDSYITQMMRLQQIQQDITAGRGINPIVERFASERLDSIARLLENINLTEAERNRLIEQYRIEQEKVLAIQQKQQQLDFINQQLALINQLRDLDEKENWAVDVEAILSGIGLGMNASIDDLMRLTARVLDELVRFANHELGIASPSKVFAKVGTNIMAGLESGILAGMRQPMNALRSAAGNLVPYSLTQRALNINMGGVTINDGMDAVMFEARIRQIVRSEFAA